MVQANRNCLDINKRKELFTSTKEKKCKTKNNWFETFVQLMNDLTREGE